MRRYRRQLEAALVGLAALMFCATAAVAQSPDPHQIYEAKCATCHAAHAGEFAREKLHQSNGQLTIRGSSKDLRAFLEAGHGRLTPTEIEPLLTHLREINASGALFQRKCRMCHDRAVEFSRLNLKMSDGRLTGRYSNRDIAEFLLHHGRLEKDEVATMIEVLKRQLR